MKITPVGADTYFGELDDKNTGRIIEKEIILPEICCRNVQLDIEIQDIIHTCCSIVFA